jgi:hypothetical protein
MDGLTNIAVRMTVKLDLAYAVSANLVLPPVVGITLCRWAMFVRPSITAQMIRFIRGNYREFCRNQ